MEERRVTVMGSSSNSNRLENVDRECIAVIMQKCGSLSATFLGCTSRRFKHIIDTDDAIYRHFCEHELALLQPHDHFGNDLLTFKMAYIAWRDTFSAYDWDTVRRVKRCWEGLKSWAHDNFPEVYFTLRPGVSETELDAFQATLNVVLPHPTRIFYRLMNGQVGDASAGFLGLIGGYKVEQVWKNVALLSLEEAEQRTLDMREDENIRLPGTDVLVAAHESGKYFLLDTFTTQLLVLDVDYRSMPCVPIADIRDVDGLLIWLEEHLRRLNIGEIRLRDTIQIRRISLYPDGPFSYTAVTHGIQVRLSVLFVPEESNEENFEFTYLVRILIPAEGFHFGGAVHTRGQISHKRWLIIGDGLDYPVYDTESVNVIGQRPMLHAGVEWAYDSSFGMEVRSGSMEGRYKVIPGSEDVPEDEPFYIDIPRCPLFVPKYMF